jgi:hypothetical protein
MGTTRFYSGVAALGIVVMVTPMVALAQSKSAFVGRLPCADAVTTLRHGTFRLPVGRVRLSEGKACIKPFPAYSHCEWDVTLVRSDRWGDRAQYLVAVVESIHDGPGAWLSVFIYRCRGDQYESVFGESYGPRGAGLILGAGSTFDVMTGDWVPGDPGCCPSRERKSSYVWDVRRQVFALSASKVTAVEKPDGQPNDQLEPAPRGR